MANDLHHDLQDLRVQLQEILSAIPQFHVNVAKPPIIGSSLEAGEDSARSDPVRGLRLLKESVKRDLDVLEKFLALPDSSRRPALSTNAPYLIAVWREVVNALPPVVSVWSTFSENGVSFHSRRRGLPKDAGVKVDVVAEGGKRWIRVNTRRERTKNSRLLAEFREIDSYLTESDSDSEAEDGLPSLVQTEFDNSILRMGRSLLAAAKENPLPGTTVVPHVTLRLTRLDPTPENEQERDPRVAQTIDKLREMGMDVQLGEWDVLASLRCSTPSLPPTLEPSQNINLDLSILIALVSDLTHSPLPTSALEAEERFMPGQAYLEWKTRRTQMLQTTAAAEDSSTPNVDHVARPARALVQQALQEMHHALIEDIHDRIAALKVLGDTQVAFWTTPEARERCLQIVDKIGGPKEKQRAEQLFSSCDDLETAEERFWQHSRYPEAYISLLPIRMLPAGEPPHDLQTPWQMPSGEQTSPFFRSLAKTCRRILAQETIPHPRLIDFPDASDGVGDGQVFTEIQRAAVMKANPRLTAHTVQSMLWGAVRGWTTLTANKTSVKALLREMKATRHEALWDAGDESELAHNMEQPPVTPSDSGKEIAALWTVDPRSLAEGMRADVAFTAQAAYQ